jgi:hypothetical protein
VSVKTRAACCIDSGVTFATTTTTLHSRLFCRTVQYGLVLRFSQELAVC